jgi:predicted nucleic acid-binding protein
MVYLIDSNVYIHAFRDSDFGQSLQEFQRGNLPRLVLSAVVIHELLVGADNNKVERLLRRGLIIPFQTRRRIHVPGRNTWEIAARIDHKLRKKPNLLAKLRTRSFANDILIAASSRELGATILTENVDDFDMIGSAIELRFTTLQGILESRSKEKT